MDQLAGVRRLGGAREQAVGAQTFPACGRAVLGQRAGDAQRQPGVLVGAVGVAQVLVRLAVAESIRAGRRRRTPGRVRPARAARSPRAAGALHVSADDQHAVVGGDGAERLAPRQRRAELVQRKAQPRPLGGRSSASGSPPRAQGEHPIPPR